MLNKLFKKNCLFNLFFYCLIKELGIVIIVVKFGFWSNSFLRIMFVLIVLLSFILFVSRYFLCWFWRIFFIMVNW